MIKDLAANQGWPIIEGIKGGVASYPGAGSSRQHLFVQGMCKWFGGKVLNAYL